MTALTLSPEDFQRLAQRVMRHASAWLEGLEGRAVLPATSGEATEALFSGPLPEEGLGEGALDALDGVLAACRAGNGRFFGYVLGSGEPVAALGDLLASVVNSNVTAWRSAPAAVSMERALVRELGRALGLGGFGGSLTAGGSSANLMALAMAREAVAPANEEGGASGVVYASREAHMSLHKAVALLGLGRRNLRLLEVDEGYRLRPEALAFALAQDVAARRRPLAPSAATAPTPSGSRPGCAPRPRWSCWRRWG